jgi:hypothetical protein
MKLKPILKLLTALLLIGIAQCFLLSEPSMGVIEGPNKAFIENFEKNGPKMDNSSRITSYPLVNFSSVRFFFPDLFGNLPQYSADYMQKLIQLLQTHPIDDHSENVVLAIRIISKIERGEPVEYNNVIIKGDLDLGDVSLSKDANKLSVVNSRIRITNSKIEGTLNCSDIFFNKSVNFSNTLFDEDISFWGAQFRENVNFSNAQFGRYADFADVQFWGDAIFLGGQFNRYTDFADVQFRGTSVFESAQFNGIANFRRVQFSGDADFRGAKFNEDVLADIWFQLMNIYPVSAFILVGLFLILLGYAFILRKKYYFSSKTGFPMVLKRLFKKLYRKFPRGRDRISRLEPDPIQKSQLAPSLSYDQDVLMKHQPKMSKHFR